MNDINYWILPLFDKILFPLFAPVTLSKYLIKIKTNEMCAFFVCFNSFLNKLKENEKYLME